MLTFTMITISALLVSAVRSAAAASEYYPGSAWEQAHMLQERLQHGDGDHAAPAAHHVPPPPGGSPAQQIALMYPLAEGVCVNGEPAVVYVYHEPADKGTSNDWVLQFGGAPSLNWCIDEQHCAIFGVPPKTPPKIAANMTLEPGGPQNSNCTQNPDWCVHHAMCVVETLVRLPLHVLQ